MCCFSRPVRHVSQTRIFGRSVADGRQVLVYSMHVGLTEDLAMILPLPTPPGAAEDAVRFIDLSGYPDFFTDLERAFPDVLLAPQRGGSRAGAPEQPRLRVHAVGCFDASFVPAIRDFERLDERFRLPSHVWDKLPQYRDYGFAVFKLRGPRGVFGWLKRKQAEAVHPMAMEFPRRDAQSLFFPTVHVHDGELHPEAHFDHALFCQPDPHLELLLDWERSDRPLGALMDETKGAGVINGGAHGYRRVLLGPQPNRDVVIDEPTLRATAALGEHFLLRVKVTGTSAAPPAGGWPELAPADRDRIKEDLVRKLSRLTRDREDAWRLARYRGDLPDRWPTFYEAFPEEGTAPPQGEPCRIKFFVWNERIEPQEICLAFSDMPSSELRESITRELQQALDEVSGA